MRMREHEKDIHTISVTMSRIVVPVKKRKVETKLFDLYCNGSVILQMRSMALCKAMERRNKKMAQYRGCTFKIVYNSTTR